MSPEVYLAYVVACALVAVLPGPTVTLIVANSLSHGTRAGLLNVAGTQLRFAGAAYLVWLGWRLLRSSGGLDGPGRVPAPRGGFFLQGFLVMLSNPKVLLFFGAFIPQFVDPRGNHVSQVALLGVTAMVVAMLSDGGYAVLTGRAGTLLAGRHVRRLSRASGLCLIGGGLWLALTRAR